MHRAGRGGALAAVARGAALVSQHGAARGSPVLPPHALLAQCTHAAGGARAIARGSFGSARKLLPALAQPLVGSAARAAAAVAVVTRNRGYGTAYVVAYAGCAAAVAAAACGPVAVCDAPAHAVPAWAVPAAAAAGNKPEGPQDGAERAEKADAATVVATAPVAATPVAPPAARGAGGFAELFALAREQWAPLLSVALLTLASTLLKLLVTRRMGGLYELAGKKRAPGGAPGVPSALQLRPLLAVLGLRIGEGCFRALQAWAWARAAARIEQQLASRAFAALLRTDMAALDLTHTGALAAHVAQDAVEATRALETMAFKGVRNVTSVVAGAATLGSVSPQISLLALSMVPPATVLFVAVGKWGARLSKYASAKAQAASAFAAERLGAVRTVRVFAQESAECGRYEAALAAARDARDAHATAHAAHVGLLTALPGMGMGLWLYFGSELVARGVLSVGALTTVVPLVVEVAGALGGLSRLHASLVHGAEAAARLRALDDAPRAIEGAHGGAALARVRGAVGFEAVRFAYPARPHVRVLDGFSLTLAPGEVFALVGASGSGKSTVAALLTRLYDVDAGRITLDGVDVRTLDPRALRQAIGMVVQEPVLFTGTIGDNIAFARPGAPHAAVVAAASSANAHAFVSALPLGYNTPVGERGAQLSGGQRQRIAIARVLLGEPAFLVLDEATSALDTESERLVSEALQSALRGRTCIIIAHRLSTTRRADRIGVMAGGRLVEVGTHDQLMALRGAYWRLVQSAAFLEDAQA
jgi:ABC-type multidrug transport system fused ATPase/permease subunit